MSSKQPLEPYECHLQRSLLVHSELQFATHLPLPLRFNGSSPEGASVRANTRQCTKMGNQTSTQFCSTLFYSVNSTVAYPDSLCGPQHTEFACVCICAVAFLPDSHPPSNWETKDRPNDDAAEGPRSAGRVGDGKRKGYCEHFLPIKDV